MNELKITVRHRTRDMSVAGEYENHLYVSSDHLAAGQRIDSGSLECGTIDIIEADDQRLLIGCGGEQFEAELGREVSSKYYIVDNPYLSLDMMQVAFEYRRVPAYKELFNTIIDIGCNQGKDNNAAASYRARQEDALHFIDLAISRGNVQLYPAKALLSSANDWATCQIERRDTFKKILLEGIGKGCLAPANHVAWDWMEIASKYNDPTFFVDDMELYYDILATAVGDGNTIALDLMDYIWEPENIIEED